MASVSDKKVREMTRLAIQLMQVVVDIPVLRAHSGYISELIVHGIGPMPVVQHLHISNLQNQQLRMMSTAMYLAFHKEMTGATKHDFTTRILCHDSDTDTGT